MAPWCAQHSPPDQFECWCGYHPFCALFLRSAWMNYTFMPAVRISWAMHMTAAALKVDTVFWGRTRRAQTHCGMLLRIRTFAVLVRALLMQRRSDVSMTCLPLQKSAMRTFIVSVREQTCISMKLELRGGKRSIDLQKMGTLSGRNARDI